MKGIVYNESKRGQIIMPSTASATAIAALSTIKGTPAKAAALGEK